MCSLHLEYVVSCATFSLFQDLEDNLISGALSDSNEWICRYYCKSIWSFCILLCNVFNVYKSNHIISILPSAAAMQMFWQSLIHFSYLISIVCLSLFDDVIICFRYNYMYTLHYERLIDWIVPCFAVFVRKWQQFSQLLSNTATWCPILSSIGISSNGCCLCLVNCHNYPHLSECLSVIV